MQRAGSSVASSDGTSQDAIIGGHPDSATLRALDGDLVRIGKTGQQACDGDSGGPALLSVGGVETLIATDDLAATDLDCAQGNPYRRVALHLGFIDALLRGSDEGQRRLHERGQQSSAGLASGALAAHQGACAVLGRLFAAPLPPIGWREPA